MRIPTLILALISALPAFAQPADPFPKASPEGGDVEAMKELADTARGLVERDESVGAELLVIKDGKTILHEAHGFKDRESKTPMERDTIFCIRSMTKPVAGTAIQMLIDEGRIKLADKVSKYLPAFDNDSCRDITIEQLLTHRAGLPLSLINKPLSEYKSRVDIVAQIAEQGPMFPIGQQFSYSDCGADTLGAIVDAVGGGSVESIIQLRILEPLGMRDTLSFVAAGDPRRPRISSNYLGGVGAWNRYWTNTDPPIFPFLFTSQSMYSSPKDYARFLSFWMNRGVVDGKRLLSEAAVDRALTPASTVPEIPTGYTSVQLKYGQLWMVYTDPATSEVVIFGHGGSDGTSAIAIPRLKLMVLYFTQARMSTATSAIDAVIDRRYVAPLLGKAPTAPTAAPPADMDRLTGLYWSEDDGMYRGITRDGDHLNLEIPGAAVVKLIPEQEGRWAVEIARNQKLEFELGPNGPAAAMIAAVGGDRKFRLPRITPDPAWPTVDQVIEKHIQGHHSAGMTTMPPFQRTGTIEMPQRKLNGTIRSLISGKDQFRTEIDLGVVRQVVILDRDRGYSATTGQAVTEATGAVAEQQALDHPAALFSDPRPFFKEVSLVGKTEVDGKPAYILRAVPKLASPSVFLVDAESGLLLGQERVVNLPGIGMVGASVRYSDTRDVGGILLPFRIEIDYNSPLLGSTKLQFAEVDLHPEVPADAFIKPEPIPAK